MTVWSKPGFGIGPALVYAAEQTASNAPSAGYATIYPLPMFLRVLSAQLLILIFG